MVYLIAGDYQRERRPRISDCYPCTRDFEWQLFRNSPSLRRLPRPEVRADQRHDDGQRADGEARAEAAHRSAFNEGINDV